LVTSLKHVARQLKLDLKLLVKCVNVGKSTVCSETFVIELCLEILFAGKKRNIRRIMTLPAICRIGKTLETTNSVLFYGGQ